MASRTTRTISLTPQLREFVDQQVASGRYRSASEVICAGLRLLQERQHQREAALAGVREKIEKGREQARRGELLDGDEVIEELLADLNKETPSA